MGTFTIQARDGYGNPILYDPTNPTEKAALFNLVVVNAAGDQFTFSQVDNPMDTKNNEVSITHAYDNVYVAAIRTMEASVVTVDVLLSGLPIANSGKTIVIKPGTASPAHTYVFNAKLNKLGAGTMEDVYIRTRDQYGNNLLQGGTDIQFKIVTTNLSADTDGIGTNPLSAQTKNVDDDKFIEVDYNGEFTYFDGTTIASSVRLIDRGDGTYKGLFMIQRSGPARLEVSIRKLNEVNIETPVPICTAPDAAALCGLVGTVSDGAILLQVESGPPASRASYIYSKTTLETAISGIKSEFEIVSWDQFYNSQDMDGYQFEVRLAHLTEPRKKLGQSRFQSEPSPTRGIGYYGEYAVSFAGDYSLMVRRNGDVLKAEVAGELIPTGIVEPLRIHPGPTSGKASVVDHPIGLSYLPGLLPTDPPIEVRKFTTIAGKETDFNILSPSTTSGTGAPAAARSS